MSFSVTYCSLDRLRRAMVFTPDPRDRPEDIAGSLIAIADSEAWVAAGRPTPRMVSKREFHEMIRRELAVLWAQENARRARPRDTWQHWQQVAV